MVSTTYIPSLEVQSQAWNNQSLPAFVQFNNLSCTQDITTNLLP